MDSKQENILLIACDVCYTRKIRCDRNSPCGNCVDSRVTCLRDRQKLEKKSKAASSKDVFDAINEIKNRMSSLDASLATLIALSTSQSSDCKNRFNSRKRPRSDESYEPQTIRSINRISPRLTCQSESNSTPPFSAYEAQHLIHEELKHDDGLNSTKRETFYSALSSLKEALNTSMVKHESQQLTSVELCPGKVELPSVALIQWMLQSNDTGRSVCSESGFMPFTSQKSIARMSRKLTLLATPNFENDLASLVCVTSYAGYFLQEIVLSGHGNETGLEDRLRAEAIDYFTVARLATSRILESEVKSDLDHLQALIYGVQLAQEIGDFNLAWLIIKAAIMICQDLELYKASVLLNYADNSEEAYYCAAVCYKIEKGLAMNLGKSAILDDGIIEIDLFRPPNSTADLLDNFRIYMELAQVQSKIITSLRPVKQDQRGTVMPQIVLKMKQIWQLVIQIKNKSLTAISKYDSEMESEMVNFAYHSVQTVMFHSGAAGLQKSEYHQASLTAARSALIAVQKARKLSNLSHYNSTYLKLSLAHWTILHYPFTAFFVVFCNIVSTRHLGDYEMLRQFVDYLDDIKDISVSVSKLHKLCIPFCSLALNILSLEEDKDYHLIRTSRAQPSLHSILQSNILQSTHTTLMQGSNTLSPGHFQTTSNQSGLNGYNDRDLLWDFTDTQPVLQWLDSDFSALESTWEEMDWNMYLI